MQTRTTPSSVSPTRPKTVTPSHRAGWTVRDWCASVGVSDALLYKLGPDRRPASVKIGRKRLIVEDPSAWLLRMAEASSSAPAVA
jgi:hypothetical protein